MNKKIFFIAIILIILLWTWFALIQTGKYKINKATVPLEETDIYLSDPENNKDPDFFEAKKSLENGDIQGSVVLWEKIVKKDQEAWKFKKDNGTSTGANVSKPKIDSKIILAQTYLQYWNYYYKEKEYADKAIKTITESSQDDDYGAQGMYFVGYAYEITKRYDDALVWYEKGLKVSSNTDRLNAIFKNQIGHVYDLKWDMKNAQNYYLSSEKLWFELPANLMNRWRYEYRNNNPEGAEKYFNKLLLLNINSFTKAEVYFDLSSIFLTRKDWLDKAMGYANLWIKSNGSYPNNYISLWIWYINKWWDDFGKAKEYLNKAIELYPNSSSAYKWLGVYFYIKDDYKNAIDNFEKQFETSLKDITLMQNEREKSRKSALYDLSKTHALDQNIEKSLYYLNQLLDWKDKDYYSNFLGEFSIKNWPFEKIKSDTQFIANLQKIINLYKKN